MIQKNSINQLNEIADTPELDVVRLVIADSEQKVLLVKEADDPNWKSPGGKIHSNETILQAIQREAMEELGLIIDVTMIDKYIKASIPDSAHYRHIVSLDLSGQTPATTSEVVDFGYFSLDNLPETKFQKHIRSASQLISS